MLHRRRNPYAETLYPALRAATSGPLRAWVDAHAVDIDRVMGEAVDDLLLGTHTLVDVEARLRAKVEAAFRAQPGLVRAGLVDLALARHGRWLIYHLGRGEHTALPYKYDPYPYDFRRYAVERWREATQDRDVTGSVEKTQEALSRLGKYQIEIQKDWANWRATLTGTERPINRSEKTRKGAIEAVIQSREFGEALAETKIQAAGFDLQSMAQSLGGSRGGTRRIRQEEDRRKVEAERAAVERTERDRKNLEVARDFVARSIELHTALEEHPTVNDVRGLRKALPPGFTGKRLGDSYVVEFSLFRWQSDGSTSAERRYRWLRDTVQRSAAYTPEQVISARLRPYGASNWYAPIEGN